MNDRRCKMVKGDEFCIAFTNVKFPCVEDDGYQLSETDGLEFSIGRKGREAIIKKRYPNGIEKEAEGEYVVYLSAKETALLPCLVYQMRLTVDFDNTGDKVYTIVNRVLEVVAK